MTVPVLVQAASDPIGKFKPMADLIGRLQAMPRAALEELFRSIGRKQFPDDERLRAKIVADVEFEIADAAGDQTLPIVLVLYALRWGALVSYVQHPNGLRVHPISAVAWSVMQMSEAMRSIEDGDYRAPYDKFAPQTLDREVGNRPLMVKEKESRKFLAGAVDPGLVSRVAINLIKAHGAESAEPMLKAEFMDSLIANTACSGAHAERVWRLKAPAAWRKGGRRPQHRS